ncbi:unnamed protein product [Polarella glacialis]|uniref:Uncharacterized protein n=1 Tax=Polarella glacialis TaxID=89957 RepID=A0A813L565_POLGL|nr:unnamed protein product [Polarella glacialis]
MICRPLARRQMELARRRLATESLAGWNMAIAACSSSGSAAPEGGNWQKALWLLSSMRLGDVMPTQISYGLVLRSMARSSGAWEAAVALLRELSLGPAGGRRPRPPSGQHSAQRSLTVTTLEEQLQPWQ